MGFREEIYNRLREVPCGKVTTYKELAHSVDSKAYRAVGTAMNKNPYAPEVPCHRVVNSNGKIGGFGSGVKNKIKLLRKEGVKVKNNKIVDFNKKLYKFK